MTLSERTQRAATLLLGARATGRRLSELPDGSRPRDVAEAYAVQDAIVAATGPIGAWKVGAKSPRDVPQCAPLCRVWVVSSPARFTAGAFALNGIEAELAYTIARDLPPRSAAYTPEELAASVTLVHPVLEVVDSRFVDFRAVDPLCVLADFASHGALVVAQGVRLPRGFDVRDQRVELDIDARQVASGTGSNPAGDPFRLLAWLANHAASRCDGLREGMVVTTGSWTGLSLAPSGAAVAARFAGIGEARIEPSPI